MKRHNDELTTKQKAELAWRAWWEEQLVRSEVDARFYINLVLDKETR